ncbi:MAG: hypothetical protein K2K75_08225 [Muribaculaceae bacterium]|nr:hypothetical protein [Muribaculaceae bacterium]
MKIEKKVTKDYCVAGHRFGVTADEEYLRLMDNYEPFSLSGHLQWPPETFALVIAPDTPPEYAEELRQVDEEQTITCGKTPYGSPVFGFQWCGVTAGWLVCSDDYREGRLIMTGSFRKLAIDNALMIMYALATAGEMTLLFHAAVVSLNGWGYMFLGPSGTGKSTHARLWVQHITGSELVDDITLMGDGNLAATEYCKASDIKATATHAVDSGGKVRYLYTRRRWWMARLWKQARMMGDFTIESLALRLCEEYDVTADVAIGDVAGIVGKWREMDVVE